MTGLDWSLGKIAEIVDGKLYGEASSTVQQVVIDSRGEVASALFVAVRGERFDGHDFLDDVSAKKAIAVLVEKQVAKLSIPHIVVKSSINALGALGLARRCELSGPVVAITGSSGKTTTRRLLASIMGERYVTHQPVGNYNNHIGVPLTLLGIEARHEAAVLELGCSDFGEIATLTKYSDPDVALVTNVGPAHLEKLVDLEGVSKAKGELFTQIRDDTTAVINLDDPKVAAMPQRAGRRISFSTKQNADVRLIMSRPAGTEGQELVFDIQGKRVEGVTALIGAHNAVNATAAGAAALAVGLGRDEIVAGLARTTPQSGRLALKEGFSETTVIDDTYNANPASMRAAIAVLTELKNNGRAIAVLGDMLELGKQSESRHLALGRYVVEQGVELLVTMGKLGAFIDQGAAEAGLPLDRRLRASDHADAAELVRERVEKGDAILVKGSRGMQMEKVVPHLLKGRN